MSRDDEQRGQSPARPDLDMETTPHGRYIPYSGGSMGWFENQSVLRCERNNRYRFHLVMESEYVRAALFQRWGRTTDKRGAERIAKENSVNLLMSDRSVPETAYHLKTAAGVLEGKTKDISHYGMRLTFAEPVQLSKGDAVTVQLMDSSGRETALELPATVVWIKREVVIRPVWFVGVAFQQLTHETEAFFSEFLGR
jgi:hypothetical protein